MTFASPATQVRLRVAVVGCGQRGQAQIARLGQAGVRVVLAADPLAANRDAALRLGALNAMEVNDALWNDDIDAVLIATPDATHGDLARLAIAAGKHVYVERPLAMPSDEARALHAAASQRGLAIEVGSDTPGLAGWRAAAEVAARGEVGPLRWVQVHDRHCAGGQRHAGAGWRDHPAQHAGVFADPFFDMLAPVMALFQPGALCGASAAGSTHAPSAPPRHMMASLQFAGGPTVVLHTGLPAADGAIAVLRGRDATVRVFATHAEVWPEAGSEGPSRHEASSGDTLHAWLAATSDQGSCVFGLEAARRTQEALDAAHAAWLKA
jgi:predicted dehydrogenase